MESHIQELITAIDQSEKTEEVKEWMKQISEPEFGLIDSFIQTFINIVNASEINVDEANQILKALRKLNEWVSECILHQMRKNKEFPTALRDYIVKVDIQQKVGDVFVLLGHIFEEDNFNSITNSKFVYQLMDDFESIDDENVFRQLVIILIKISYDFKHKKNSSNDSSMVLELIQTHQNQRYISEKLTGIINMGDESNLKECLQFVLDVYEQKYEFFYTAELKILIEILIKQILEQSSEEMRQMLLTVLLVIIQDEKYKDIKHRISDIEDMSEQLKLLSQNNIVLDQANRIDKAIKAL